MEVPRFWRNKAYLLNPNANGYRPSSLPDSSDIHEQGITVCLPKNEIHPVEVDKAVIYQAPVGVST